jgi:hypothetical protein
MLILKIGQSLDELQTIHLKPVLHFPFAAHMLSTVPSTQSQIRDAVTRDFKSWLFEARNESRNVGRLALDAMEQRNRRWRARKARDPDGTFRLARVGSPIECGISERHERE